MLFRSQIAIVEQQKENDSHNNLIAELRKTISEKESEIVNLKYENTRIQIELEDCKKHLKIQIKKLESFNFVFGDQQLAPYLVVM